jgi:hypothetical protein
MLGCGSCILPTVDQTLDVQTRKGTRMLSAKWFVSGVSLAVTVGAAYTACALVFWIWPESAVNFVNALFHGMDFRQLCLRRSAPGSALELRPHDRVARGSVAAGRCRAGAARIRSSIASAECMRTAL